MSLRVWCALVTAQLGLGAYGVIVTKFAKGSKTDPLVFCLLRDAGAFPVMLLAAFLIEGKVIVPSLRSVPLLMVLGFTGIFTTQLLYILGVYLTTANMAAMFQPAVPVWCSFMAMISGVEPYPKLAKSHGWAKILGILLAVTGAVTMTLGKFKKNSGEESWFLSGSSVGSQFLGCICLIVKTSSTAVYFIIQKKYIFNRPHSMWKTRPMAVTAWSYFFAMVFLGLISLFYVNQPDKFMSSFSKEAFLSLVYAVFITSTMCSLLLSWCNMQVRPTIVAASWTLQVLFCAVLSSIFLGQSLEFLECFGGSFIACGLIAVLWSNYKEEKELLVHEQN